MIPDYQIFFQPVLMFFSQGIDYKSMFEHICQYFQFTEEDKTQTVTNGTSRIMDRISWARTYLGKVGFVQREGRGVWKISDFGKMWIQTFPHEQINNKILCIISEPFQIFLHKSIIYQTMNIQDLTSEKLAEIRENIKPYRLAVPKISADSTDMEKSTHITNPIEEENQDIMTPAEQLESVYNSYKNTMISIIKDSFYEIEPFPFEKMVLDVLTRCGYGYEELNQVTSKTRDGGIDGIIFKDKLGVEKIGVQTKRYNPDTVVSSPDIHRFMGALSSAGLRSGIFVSSSRFSKDALILSKNHANHSIVMVDGEKLASLMFEYSIGIITEKEMKLVDLDKNFFERYNSPI